VNVFLVMVLDLSACSRFLTKDFVDTDVLVGGTNFSFVFDFSKIFWYLGFLTDVRIVGQTDLWWLVG
jgi:hypothetical protein